MASYFRYQALGGLGEIGMNCAILEADNRAILLDCGVTFPDDDHFGINLIIPDFAPILDIAHKLDAIIITHGHMDHIGAISFLLAEISVPIYAPAFAMKLIQAKLEEHNLLAEATLIVTKPGQDTLDLGSFKLDFIHVNHSIPNSLAILIQTKVGNFFHTGDFKFDPEPLVEQKTDIDALQKIGDKNVRVLFSDSTNIFRTNPTGSESSVAQNILKQVKTAKRAVYMVMFSTNLWRVQAAINAAIKTKRKLIILGRSLIQSVQIGRDLGILTIPGPNPIVSEKLGRKVSPNKRLIICTGSQGEPRAVLTRIANESFPKYRIRKGDRVIFSSRVIPGNEIIVENILDLLAKSGAEIVLGKEGVHVSGHGHRADLAKMIRLIRPKNFIPVHGTYRFQLAHEKLAREMAVESSFVLENGDIIEFRENSVGIVAKTKVNRWVTDNQYTFGKLDGIALKERKQLARLGLIIVWMTIDKISARIIHGPVITNLGAMEHDKYGQNFIKEVKEEVKKTIAKLSPPFKTPEEINAPVSLAIRQFFRRELGRKPLIESISYLV